MYAPHNRYVGACIASLLAGPIFLCALAIGMLAENIEPTHLDTTDLFAIPALILASVVFGTLISIVPNLIGTAAMLWMNDHLDDAGLPIVWMLVGGLLAGAVADLLLPTETFLIFAFGLTGAASALICWRFADPPRAC
jgi:hypothetical protein